MTSKMLLIAIISVGLSALAQLSLKIGSSAALSPDIPLRALPLATVIKAVFLNPHILIGFFLYGIGALTWLLVLSRVELSVAYPFVALGLIITMLLGALVLQESVGLLRMFGGLLIVLGVLCVAYS